MAALFCPARPSLSHPSKLFAPQILHEAFPDPPLSTKPQRLNPTLTACFPSFLLCSFLWLLPLSPNRVDMLKGKAALCVPYLLTEENHPLWAQKGTTSHFFRVLERELPFQMLCRQLPDYNSAYQGGDHVQGE